MPKLVAIIRHEYFKRVRSVGFIITTVLGPILLAATFLIPIVIAFIQPAAPRIAVVDESGKIYEALSVAVAAHRGWALDHSNPENTNAPHSFEPSTKSVSDLVDFKIEKVDVSGRPLDDVRRELMAQVMHGRLDALLIIPADVLTSGTVEYFSRNAGDPLSNEQFDDYLSRAIIEQRLTQAGISPNQLPGVTRTVRTNRVRLSERGEEKLTGAAFYQGMGVGILLFVTLISYGGSMLGAVQQEKESRLGEILFSSVRPLTLLLGKLIGVSLVAFTQYAIWISAFLFFTVVSSPTLVANAPGRETIGLPVSFFLYLLAFFMVGYFTYASLSIAVGTLMTENDERSYLSFLSTTPMLIAFSMAMPVMRSPNSWMAIVASLIPFFSPILMPIRLIAQQPPAWQILLSLLFGVVGILLSLRLAAVVYRTGMLMYGKKVSIPEVLRWMRQT